MPKTSQRKKKLKNQDFQKQKLKVGKKKLAPSTQTDISFKTKAIYVPDQGIVEEKKEITSSRNLTLKELLGQAKHYSSITRKDALNGIKEIYTNYPDEIFLNLGTVFEKTIPIFIDKEPDVRLALLQFYKILIPDLKIDQIKPFMSVFMAYLCSAMTHILEDIRLDSLKFLKLFIDNFPTLTIYYSDKLIPNFLNHLTGDMKMNSKSNSSSLSNSLLVNPKSKLGSTKSRAAILTSFYDFLSIIINDNQNLSNNNKNEDIKENININWTKQSSIQIYSNTEHVYNKNNDNSVVLDIFNAEQKSNNSTDRIDKDSLGISETNTFLKTQNIKNSYNLNNKSQLKDFMDILLPVLFNCWIETSSDAFIGNVNFSPTLVIIKTIIQIQNLVWKKYSESEKESNEWVESYLKLIINHMMIYFPFGNEKCSIKDQKTEDYVKEINIIFCELLSTFLSLNWNDNSKLITICLNNLMKYFNIFFGKRKNEKFVMINDIKAEHLNTLFPAILKLINSLPQNDSLKIVDIISEYFMKVHSQSGAKRSLIKFINQLLNENNLFYQNPVFFEHIKKVFSSLPRLMWELKTVYLNTTETIFDILLKLFKFGINFQERIQFLENLQMTMIPYFYVEIPNKGSIFGPFIQLPCELQKKLINIIYYFPTINEKLFKAILTCCKNKFLSSETIDKILEVFELRQNLLFTTKIQPQQYLSFILTILMGYNSNELETLNKRYLDKQVIPALKVQEVLSNSKKRKIDDDEINAKNEQIANIWKRQNEINNSVVKRLKSLNGIPQNKILNLLEPFTVKVFNNSLPDHSLYGLVFIIMNFIKYKDTCSKSYVNILCQNITRLLESIWSKDNYMTTPEYKYIFNLTKYIFNNLYLEMINYLSKDIIDINKAKMAYRLLNDIILKLEPNLIRKIQSLKVMIHELKKVLTNQQEIDNLQKILRFLDY
ncbi:hypothetical protein BCR32DRAFT_289738 [Anaeromyces robustus]|uniref:Pre-rRNA-processing protein n=1 Tax=Anaeromyces robustus TaxID=1754192 RepID=A0A1Y1XM32_9FUNG|nr:hypothetical protein BCR32DRAFT_289738 [Anaeromyces robustus]|eukprot:ORX86808.1 hypothetical protein BCR32DRAFT_289738 [Anaeromyces robustus]